MCPRAVQQEATHAYQSNATAAASPRCTGGRGGAEGKHTPPPCHFAAHQVAATPPPPRPDSRVVAATMLSDEASRSCSTTALRGNCVTPHHSTWWQPLPRCQRGETEVGMRCSSRPVPALFYPPPPLLLCQGASRRVLGRGQVRVIPACLCGARPSRCATAGPSTCQSAWPAGRQGRCAQRPRRGAGG